MDELRLEGILRVAECLPAGQVATYGDLGAVTGESPRVVGWALANWGSGIAWWRICNVRGEIPGHMEDARSHWQAEGTPLTPDGRVALNLARMGAEALAHLAAGHLAELDEGS